MKALVLIVVALAFVGMFMEPRERETERIDQGRTLVVTKPFKVYTDEWVPVATFHPGVIAGVGKHKVGSRIVYLVADPSVRGWVNADVLMECTE